METMRQLIELGGASMVAILLVSVVMLAIIIIKIIQFFKNGYWTLDNPTANDLIRAASGLKWIEIASIIAPLLGLLGTVLGMISAFQALESAGGSPEIETLASGIWKALSTTAAGMVVAIIATIFLGLFDSALERMQVKIGASK